MNLIVDTLCKVRGAALKLGQMLSIQGRQITMLSIQVRQITMLSIQGKQHTMLSIQGK